MIKDLIDGNGVLRIPELMNVVTFDSFHGLFYRIERVGHNTFDYLKDLKKVQIPATVTNIECCFYDCRNLSAINVDEANPEFCSIDGVLYTKDHKKLIAYPNAHGKEYIVPDGVEEIGHFTFKSCCDLEVIKLPKTVKKIGTNAFYRCDKLKYVYIPDGIRKIGDINGNTSINFHFIYHGKQYSYYEFKKMFQ